MRQHGLDPARVARVSDGLSVRADEPVAALCSAAARVVGVSGAGVILVSGGQTLTNVCVSDPIAEAVEEAQYTLGQGPCIDAYSGRMPVLVPDLARAPNVRWTEFCERACAIGVRAAFGFPLMIDRVCLGALNLYQARAGALTDDQLADAVVVAYLASRTVLGWQSVAGAGSLAWQLEQVPKHRAVIHQAAGMVSVQAGVAVDDALTLLRAFAFAEGQWINDVARNVVQRQLRFDDPSQPPGS